MEKAKRYLIFLLGLFLSSLGVSLVTKADLGTSPISAIPYVLSLKFPLTLGQFTIAFSLLLIFLQLLILRRRFRLEHLLQIPISIAFGYFIDLTMGLLFFVSPGSYPEKVLYLLVGCAVLAFGVYLEVLADVAMLPGESFVRAVVLTWNTDFGTTKVCFDVSMTAIAVAASLILSGHLAGVREGTLVAALLVGFLARTFGRMLSFLPGLLFPPQEEDTPKPAAGRGYVIAIGRQYGSGGRIIGRLLADRLNYQFYDEEIIQLTAGTTGFTPQFVHQQEESMTSPLLYDFTNQMYYAPEQEGPQGRPLCRREADHFVSGRPRQLRAGGPLCRLAAAQRPPLSAGVAPRRQGGPSPPHHGHLRPGRGDRPRPDRAGGPEAGHQLPVLHPRNLGPREKLPPGHRHHLWRRLRPGHDPQRPPRPAKQPAAGAGVTLPFSPTRASLAGSRVLYYNGFHTSCF